MLDVREKTSDANVKNSGSIPEADLQSKIAEQMMGLFDAVISERSSHFAKNPGQLPDRNSVNSIIDNYSNSNMVISGAAGLVDWGLNKSAISGMIKTSC